MKIKLIFLDSFETEFKDSKYLISRFADPSNLDHIICGTNLNLSFIPYKIYNCTIEWNSSKNKFKVVEASE